MRNFQLSITPVGRDLRFSTWLFFFGDWFFSFLDGEPKVFEPLAIKMRGKWGEIMVVFWLFFLVKFSFNLLKHNHLEISRCKKNAVNLQCEK